MDSYYGVVFEFLQSDRSLFLNTGYSVQLNPGGNAEASGPYWSCDAVALDFRKQHIYLCEIAHTRSPADLILRLHELNEHWDQVRAALQRDSHLPEWPVSTWIFIPEQLGPALERGLERAREEWVPKFQIRVSWLEETAPWKSNARPRQSERA